MRFLNGSADARCAQAFGFVSAALACAPPAFAHPTSSELAAKFARGDYFEAATEAEAAAGADDLAFAARALLAHCMTGTSQPDAAIVERASKDAEAALKLDPGTRKPAPARHRPVAEKPEMDVLAAWTAGYGDKGRRLAREVLKSDPVNFYAHGFLAVWNVEVERRGGTGAWMMGRVRKGRKHYQSAAKMRR